MRKRHDNCYSTKTPNGRRKLDAYMDFICNCPVATSRVTWREETQYANLVVINRISLTNYCYECGDEYYHTHSNINECNNCHYSQRPNPVAIELYGEFNE